MTPGVERSEKGCTFMLNYPTRTYNLDLQRQYFKTDVSLKAPVTHLRESSELHSIIKMLKNI